MSLTTTEPFDDAALAAMIAAATVLGTDLKAGLFVNNHTPTKTTVLADLTEPTFTGYARQAVVMGAPFRDPTLGIVSLGTTLTWQETMTPVSVIIYGVLYVTGTGPSLMGAELFPTPIPLNDLLDAFSTALMFIQSSDNPGFTTIIR